MDNNFANIKDRALEIARTYGIGKEEFCKSINMSYGSFKGSAKERPLNSDAIVNILTKYNDIDAYWFVLGIGSKFKDGASNANSQQNNSTPSIEDIIANRVLEKLSVNNKILEKKMDMLFKQNTEILNLMNQEFIQNLIDKTRNSLLKKEGQKEEN